MRWSWRIGRIAGIGVYVHATFLLLLAWVVLLGYRAGGTLAAALPGLALILTVFGIVVLHELGHALTARRFGIATRDITLLPIGGVARLERMPRDPRQELLVALAGPAVNVVLALVLVVPLFLVEGRDAALGALLPTGRLLDGSLLATLVGMNVWLALFNLLPAFPMDGGRVLRALLAMRTGSHVRATATAARVGRAFAVIFGLGGLFVWNNPFLVFIAVFVWLGATGEAAAEQTSATLEGVTLAQVMITDLRTLAPWEPLSRAVELTLGGFQQDFPVLEHGALVGLLTRQDLLRGLQQAGLHAPVVAVMRREFATARPDEMVEEALGRLRGGDARVLPVVRGRELLGVLTTDNVSEFVSLRAALRGVRGAMPVA
jgi:Zn-dependent protease